MCGICFIENEGSGNNQVCVKTSRLLNRGPDAYGTHCFHCDNRIGGELHGCVLVLRHHLVKQPLTDVGGNSLLWNGEIFGGIQVTASENDGSVLLNLLTEAQTEKEILEIFGRIQGPWSFVFWQHKTQTVWFGHDIFGRRSLLWSLPQTENDRFALSSIAIDPLQWREVPATGIYSMNYSVAKRTVKLFPWHHLPASSTVDDGTSGIFSNSDHFNDSYFTFERSVSVVPIYLMPFNVSVPQEGDLYEVPSKQDSCLISKNDTYDYRNDGNLTENQNSGSQPGQTRSRKTNTASASVSKPKQNDSQSYCQMTSQDLLEMATAEQLDVAQKFLSVLAEAVRVRVQNQMDYCDTCLQVRLASQSCGDGDRNCEAALFDDASNKVAPDVRCVHARVGVLFSGGIDSLMIAALADRFVPEDEPIDLMNVAFELQPKRITHQPGKKTRKLPPLTTEDCNPYLVPDRLTGLSGLEELATLTPKRKWNFVEVNITVDELKRKRDEHICHLVYPLQTVLDDSIGCAVWFAARGQGTIRDPESGGTKVYRSTARVVLVGMGADEQLGGYSRHRNAFRRDAWSGLAEELRMEINRISERNLGRDDRIITDHGKESRFPFLDENVVSFLNSLPIWQKADLRLERGFGEKILLRQCAQLLGLHKAAVLPKRAIQFGSRIAKVEDSKEKASDVCNRLRKVTVEDS